ncbi:MAG: hypothetical protein AAFN66_11710 [Pseudomonadota bacterium]
MRYFYNVNFQWVIVETDKSFDAKNKFQFGFIELLDNFDMDTVILSIRKNIANSHNTSLDNIRNLNLVAFNKA